MRYLNTTTKTMNFLIEFSFIVSSTYIIPNYLTNWNEELISTLDLNIDQINNDMLRLNKCVFVWESEIANVELKYFQISQNDNHTQQITHKKQFEYKLLNWLELLNKNITCFNKRRILKDIDSYSIKKINELRKSEGMDSWQTELSNNPDPFGIDSTKLNSRLVTYLYPKFGTPKMTKNEDESL